MDNRLHYSSYKLSGERKTQNFTKAVWQNISISPKIVSLASETSLSGIT